VDTESCSSSSLCITQSEDPQCTQVEAGADPNSGAASREMSPPVIITENRCVEGLEGRSTPKDQTQHEGGDTAEDLTGAPSGVVPKSGRYANETGPTSAAEGAKNDALNPSEQSGVAVADRWIGALDGSQATPSSRAKEPPRGAAAVPRDAPTAEGEDSSAAAPSGLGAPKAGGEAKARQAAGDSCAKDGTTVGSIKPAAATPDEASHAKVSGSDAAGSAGARGSADPGEPEGGDGLGKACGGPAEGPMQGGVRPAAASLQGRSLERAPQTERGLRAEAGADKGKRSLRERLATGGSQLRHGSIGVQKQSDWARRTGAYPPRSSPGALEAPRASLSSGPAAKQRDDGTGDSVGDPRGQSGDLQVGKVLGARAAGGSDTAPMPAQRPAGPGSGDLPVGSRPAPGTDGATGAETNPTASGGGDGNRAPAGLGSPPLGAGPTLGQEGPAPEARSQEGARGTSHAAEKAGATGSKAGLSDHAQPPGGGEHVMCARGAEGDEGRAADHGVSVGQDLKASQDGRAAAARSGQAGGKDQSPIAEGSKTSGAGTTFSADSKGNSASQLCPPVGEGKPCPNEEAAPGNSDTRGSGALSRLGHPAAGDRKDPGGGGSGHRQLSGGRGQATDGGARHQTGDDALRLQPDVTSAASQAEAAGKPGQGGARSKEQGVPGSRAEDRQTDSPWGAEKMDSNPGWARLPGGRTLHSQREGGRDAASQGRDDGRDPEGGLRRGSGEAGRGGQRESRGDIPGRRAVPWAEGGSTDQCRSVDGVSRQHSSGPSKPSQRVASEELCRDGPRSSERSRWGECQRGDPSRGMDSKGRSSSSVQPSAGRSSHAHIGEATDATRQGRGDRQGSVDFARQERGTVVRRDAKDGGSEPRLLPAPEKQAKDRDSLSRGADLTSRHQLAGAVQRSAVGDAREGDAVRSDTAEGKLAGSSFGTERGSSQSWTRQAISRRAPFRPEGQEWKDESQGRCERQGFELGHRKGSGGSSGSENGDARDSGPGSCGGGRAADQDASWREGGNRMQRQLSSGFSRSLQGRRVDPKEGTRDGFWGKERRGAAEGQIGDSFRDADGRGKGQRWPQPSSDGRVQSRLQGETGRDAGCRDSRRGPVERARNESAELGSAERRDSKRSGSESRRPHGAAGQAADRGAHRAAGDSMPRQPSSGSLKPSRGEVPERPLGGGARDRGQTLGREGWRSDAGSKERDPRRQSPATGARAQSGPEARRDDAGRGRDDRRGSAAGSSGVARVSDDAGAKQGSISGDKPQAAGSNPNGAPLQPSQISAAHKLGGVSGSACTDQRRAVRDQSLGSGQSGAADSGRATKGISFNLGRSQEPEKEKPRLQDAQKRPTESAGFRNRASDAEAQTAGRSTAHKEEAPGSFVRDAPAPSSSADRGTGKPDAATARPHQGPGAGREAAGKSAGTSLRKGLAVGSGSQEGKSRGAALDPGQARGAVAAAQQSSKGGSDPVGCLPKPIGPPAPASGQEGASKAGPSCQRLQAASPGTAPRGILSAGAAPEIGQKSTLPAANRPSGSGPPVAASQQSVGGPRPGAPCVQGPAAAGQASSVAPAGAAGSEALPSEVPGEASPRVCGSEPSESRPSAAKLLGTEPRYDAQGTPPMGPAIEKGAVPAGDANPQRREGATARAGENKGSQQRPESPGAGAALQQGFPSASRRLCTDQGPLSGGRDRVWGAAIPPSPRGPASGSSAGPVLDAGKSPSIGGGGAGLSKEATVDTKDAALLPPGPGECAPAEPKARSLRSGPAAGGVGSSNAEQDPGRKEELAAGQNMGADTADSPGDKPSTSSSSGGALPGAGAAACLGGGGHCGSVSLGGAPNRLLPAGPTAAATEQQRSPQRHEARGPGSPPEARLPALSAPAGNNPRLEGKSAATGVCPTQAASAEIDPAAATCPQEPDAKNAAKDPQQEAETHPRSDGGASKAGGGNLLPSAGTGTDCDSSKHGRQGVESESVQILPLGPENEIQRAPAAEAEPPPSSRHRSGGQRGPGSLPAGSGGHQPDVKGGSQAPARCGAAPPAGAGMPEDVSQADGKTTLPAPVSEGPSKEVPRIASPPAVQPTARGRQGAAEITGSPPAKADSGAKEALRPPSNDLLSQAGGTAADKSLPGERGARRGSGEQPDVATDGVADCRATHASPRREAEVANPTQGAPKGAESSGALVGTVAELPRAAAAGPAGGLERGAAESGQVGSSALPQAASDAQAGDGAEEPGHGTGPGEASGAARKRRAPAPDRSEGVGKRQRAGEAPDSGGCCGPDKTLSEGSSSSSGCGGSGEEGSAPATLDPGSNESCWGAADKAAGSQATGKEGAADLLAAGTSERLQDGAHDRAADASVQDAAGTVPQGTSQPATQAAAAVLTQPPGPVIGSGTSVSGAVQQTGPRNESRSEAAAAASREEEAGVRQHLDDTGKHADAKETSSVASTQYGHGDDGDRNAVSGRVKAEAASHSEAAGPNGNDGVSEGCAVDSEGKKQSQGASPQKPSRRPAKESPEDRRGEDFSDPIALRLRSLAQSPSVASGKGAAAKGDSPASESGKRRESNAAAGKRKASTSELTDSRSKKLRSADSTKGASSQARGSVSVGKEAAQKASADTFSKTTSQSTSNGGAEKGTGRNMKRWEIRELKREARRLKGKRLLVPGDVFKTPEIDYPAQVAKGIAPTMNWSCGNTSPVFLEGLYLCADTRVHLSLSLPLPPFCVCLGRGNFKK